MMRPFPFYMQYDARDCGPTCLRMIAKYFGKQFALKTLRDRCFITRSGVSLGGISEAAESIGFHTLGVKLSFDQLVHEIQLPCIAHWKQNHFVVIYKVSKAARPLFGKKKTAGHWIYVADPAAGKVKYPAGEFKKAWFSTKKDAEERGHCLLLEPAPEFDHQANEKSHPYGLAYLLSYLKPYKGLLLQLILGFLAGSIFSLLFPFLTQLIVDKGINYKNISFLTVILCSQLALTMGAASVGFIRGWIMLHLTTRINISLISGFLSRLMRLPIAFFDSKMTGDILQRIDDNGRIQNFLTNTAVNLIFSAINFIVFSIIIATYNTTIFTIFITGSIIYILWIRFFLKYRRELDNRRFAQMAVNQDSMIQLITGMQEIKLNNCEQRKRWEWEKIQAMLFKISVKGLMVGQYQGAGAVLINSIKNFTITYFAAQSVIQGQMTLGMMLSVQYIIGQLNGPIESLTGFSQSWQDAKMSLERLGEIEQNECEDAAETEKLQELPHDKTITISNVCFRYEGPQSPHVLDNINLVIPQNKVTAIVGTSGSGKTTLLKLLLGFYQPSEGTIKVGPVSLHGISVTTWRRHTGSVMQDGFIFSDTIANNIAVSDDEADKAKLHYAVTTANIKDFIESLPSGYNTRIGSSGSGISQGQKQRMLIARAVYKNPDFLFLDEATNSLDANNETTIIHNLNEFFAGKTVVIVAHRLSTVKNADHIIVLDKGKVVEQGNHFRLSKMNGHYYNLVKNQLELN